MNTPTNDSPDARPLHDESISQDEIERLLAQVNSGDALEGESTAAAGESTGASILTQRHVFPRLSLFSPAELRKLRLRHEEFIRSLTARLAVYLRLELSMRMSRLETFHFDKFIENLSNPTHLTLIKLEPLPGICLLDVPPRLGLSIVDRELGGPGICLEETRDLSPMETRLLSQTIELIVGEWCSSWSDMLDLRPLLLTTESSARFVQTSPPDHTLLVLGIEFHIGEFVEQIQFGFPCQTLEELVVKLNATPGAASGPAAVPPPRSLQLNPAMNDVGVRLTAELPNLQITARQLAALQAGDILPIPNQMAAMVRVNLEEVPKFIGSLGTCGDQFAVKLDGTFVDWRESVSGEPIQAQPDRK